MRIFMHRLVGNVVPGLITTIEGRCLPCKCKGCISFKNSYVIIKTHLIYENSIIFQSLIKKFILYLTYLVKYRVFISHYPTSICSLG